MKKILIALLSFCAISSAMADETVYFIRHGEKPNGGLGQLNCQGLNRSLALPKVIREKVGTPDYIFAPNPSKQKNDVGVVYDYIRPLATIEPTAISFGIPINTQIGFEEKDKLVSELLQDKYQNKKIVVAWEHRLAEEITRDMINEYGDKQTIPKWDGYDFDSIYILNIKKENGKFIVSFKLDNENLNSLPKTCPF